MVTSPAVLACVVVKMIGMLSLGLNISPCSPPPPSHYESVSLLHPTPPPSVLSHGHQQRRSLTSKVRKSHWKGRVARPSETQLGQGRDLTTVTSSELSRNLDQSMLYTFSLMETYSDLIRHF